MYKIKKKSAWTWNTSAGGSASFAFVSAGSGMFALNAPGGRVVEFNYKTAQASVSIGSKVNLSHSTPDTYSVGQLYLTDTFAGAELTHNDITGFCLVQEVAIGAGVGGSGTAMLLGIPAKSLPAEAIKNTGALGIAAQLAVDNPRVTKALLGIVGGLIFDEVREPLDKLLRTNAKALLLMAGFNAGPQLQAGISGGFGYVSFERVQPPPPPPKPVPPPPPPPPGPLVITFPTDVLFDFDKSDLKPTAEAALKKIESQIRASKPDRIVVAGHTDAVGGEEYNMSLSRRRAQSVASWLLARKVVPASEMVTVGSGESRPAAPNKRPDGKDNPEGRALNRRVEVTLIDF